MIYMATGGIKRNIPNKRRSHFTLISLLFTIRMQLCAMYALLSVRYGSVKFIHSLFKAVNSSGLLVLQAHTHTHNRNFEIA